MADTIQIKNGNVNVYPIISVGAFEQKTLPFNTASVGNVLIRINPSTSTGGYATVSIGGTNVIVSSANGNGNSVCAVAPKGATIAVVSSSNVNVTAFFAPIT